MGRRLTASPSAVAGPEVQPAAGVGVYEETDSEANDVICGTQTIEGAPHLRRGATRRRLTAPIVAGRKGKRFIHHRGHIRMMAAGRSRSFPGRSPRRSTCPTRFLGEIEEAYMESWKCR